MSKVEEISPLSVAQQKANYLTEFPLVRPNSVAFTHVVAHGFEHDVHRMYSINGVPMNYFVKFPRYHARPDKIFPTARELGNDFAMLGEYFGDAVVPTYYLESSVHPDRYLAVQTEVPHMQEVTLEMLLTNKTLYKQFAWMITQNHKMYRQTGKYLPFLGHDGAASALTGNTKLTNLVVEGDGDEARLRLIDLSTLSPFSSELMEHAVNEMQINHELSLTWLEHQGTDLAKRILGHIRDTGSFIGNEVILEIDFLAPLAEEIMSGK